MKLLNLQRTIREKADIGVAEDELPVIQKTFDMLIWLIPKIDQFLLHTKRSPFNSPLLGGYHGSFR